MNSIILKTGSQDTPESEYLDKNQLAKRLKISIRTVDNMIAKGQLPFLRLSGKIIRFPWGEVLEHLNRHYRINARNEERGGDSK